MAVAERLSADPADTGGRTSREIPWYAAAVVAGSVLIVIAAIKQPFNYDELTQIAPYGSNNPVEIVSATRQPPLDPLLGGLFQHIFGMGQLRQRLVPVLAGIGVLVMMSLLLHRMRLGWAGVYGVWVLATAPLMVRYSAYTRPYGLPMFEMLLFAYAAQRWLDERRPRWRTVAAVTAVTLPLTRVPEPTMFLLLTAGTLGWLTYRGRFSWAQTRPLILISLLVLFVIGLPLYLILASAAGGFFDPSPSGVVERFGAGVHELVVYFFPLMGARFPFWPVVLLALVAVLAIGSARRRLLGNWMFWPLLAGPVAFALAYHFLNPFPFDALPYRARAAFFFLPPLILALVALAVTVTKGTVAWLRLAVSVLLAAVLLCQLPPTFVVLVSDAAPDFDEISEVLTEDIPDDAIVLYDRPTPAGQSRQPFLGSPRYMGDTPYAETLAAIPAEADSIPAHGPVYLLINGQCAAPGRCLPSPASWQEDVPGWRIVYQRERFTLYEPSEGQDGRGGVIRALVAFGEALGPELGYVETFAAASLLRQDGKSAEAKALIDRMYADSDPAVAGRIRDMAQLEQLDPFR